MSKSPVLDYAGVNPIPTVVVVPTPISVDRPDITSKADLIAVDTALLAVGTAFELITGSAGSRSWAKVELEAGAYDPSDTSQLNPHDYNAGTNNKHWQVVGGYLAP